MPTLHTATETTKNIVKWGGIAAGTIVFLYFAFRIGQAVFLMIFPPKLPPPTVTYGKIPAITFPESVDDSLTYTLDTVTGQLPVFPDRAAVYTITKNLPTLDDLSRTQNIASNMEFDGSGIPISETDYQFGTETPFAKTLTMNIIDNTFTITSDYASSSAVSDAENVPDVDTSASTVTSFLSSVSLLPGDIDASKTRTQQLALVNGDIQPAESAADTQLIRVDLFQKDIDKLPIFYPHPPYSIMNFLVDGAVPQGDIATASFFYQTVDENDSATYPIKTPQEAYDELKNGNAYIAAHASPGSDVAIKEVLLGYYMSDTPQQYLQPIYIFKTDNDAFYAYVPAVRDEWIK